MLREKVGKWYFWNSFYFMVIMSNVGYLWCGYCWVLMGFIWYLWSVLLGVVGFYGGYCLVLFGVNGDYC